MAEIGLTLRPVRRLDVVAAAAAPSRTARAQLVAAGEAADTLIGEWRDLEARALEANPFFVPEFALAAARDFGATVRILAVHGDDGRLIALAPVTASRLGWIEPALRTWSHDYGPLGVPLIDAYQRDAAAAGLLAAADRSALVLPDMTLDGPVSAAVLAAAAVAGRRVTVVGSHERAAFLGRGDARGTLSGKRRKEYARQLRRLAEEGAVRSDVAAEPDAVVAAFEEFLALEAAGWKGARGTAMAKSGKGAFARDAVARLAARRAVRINVLRFNGRMIAGLVSLVSGVSAATWKIAYDEKFAGFSPGAQVMLDAPAALAAAGATYIDSLATPDHPLANHIWKQRIAIGTIIVAPPAGAFRHRAALVSLAAEARARGLAKRLRDRLRG